MIDPDERQLSPSGKTQMPDGAIDIGNGTWITKVQDGTGEWVGINEWHHAPSGDSWEWCGGWVPFMLPGLPEAVHSNHWDIVSLEPLTLSPSLLCTSCQHHGYIRNGAWEDC